MSFQGKHSSRVAEEIMEILGLQLQKLLVRLSDKGFNLKWNNNEIISWYSAEGAKLKSKSKYKKIPAAIVYLLRRNDLATITENEKTITNIKEIERVRSDELQKLRKQVEVFAYEQQGWARQREEMATKVDHVQGKLITYSNYISALEDCCDKTGFPVAAVKQAALDETELETQTESEDDDTALACNIRPHRETRNRALVSLWPEKPSLRSPIKTRTKSNDTPKKAVKIAVLKTMTNADDEITTISRPLTCEECSRHKQVVGIMPRKGPFQPYWEALMLQANVYKLEIRDVWQIALLTIPEELRPKLNTEMKSGNIMNRVNDETDEGIYERLKQALLDMRGLSHADWSKILEIKQAGNESFETYAERLWVTYREHSGLENADRNHDALLHLVKNNAGIPVQKALSNGVDPAENTFRAIVDWGSRIENRWRLKPRSVASAQWLTEGNSTDKFSQRSPNKIICHYCRKTNHVMRDCKRREKDLKEQAKHYQKTPSSDDSELLKQFVNFKHFNIITSIWQEIRARDSSLSVVKVHAHIIKNPDENEKNNNIADQLAKLAAQKGDEWKPDRLVVPAVSAIQTIPIDLKQYQQELWSSDGELTPHLQQHQLVKVTEGMILRDDKYIVPEALQKPVIKLYHDYAHVSAPKTQQLIQKNFWWPQMASDIQRWCDTCIVCATINQGKPGRTKLCRPEPPKGPWELLQLDFIGPLPSAKGGYRYCLVIIDKFSKWVEAIPTRNNSANTVARVVANQILPLWGTPIQIESDQGTHFTGQVMKQICQMLNIKQRFHIPYRPQSSGMVERANRTIKESISKQVAQHKNQWIDALPTVLTILRATPSKATGISPFELMTGRVMKLPIDPEIAPADLGPLVVATQQSVLKQLRERLEVLHARAALKQQQSDLTNDTQFNPTSEVKFSEGDMVMVRIFVKQGAFTPRWHGPYEVKAICNSCVAITVKGKLRWYHMSQCKSFKSTQNK